MGEKGLAIQHPGEIVIESVPIENVFDAELEPGICQFRAVSKVELDVQGGRNDVASFTGMDIGDLERCSWEVGIAIVPNGFERAR